MKELAVWFGWCTVGVFGSAAAFAAVGWLTSRWLGSSSPNRWGTAAFVVGSLLLGLVGTSLFSVWADTFIFTWPASLYVAFRVTLAVVVRAEARSQEKWPRRLSRAVTLLFLAAGYGYYQLCLAVGYAMGWCFLAGFLPAAPFAVVAARARSWWIAALADGAGFAAFIWVAGLLPRFKEQWLG
jgi:hypothetical protein